MRSHHHRWKSVSMANTTNVQYYDHSMDKYPTKQRHWNSSSSNQRRKSCTNQSILLNTMMLLLVSILELLGRMEVNGQMVPAVATLSSLLHHQHQTTSTNSANDDWMTETSSSSHRKAASSITKVPKFPIRIDFGTSTYIDPITNFRWRGGSSYIQNRSLAQNHNIPETQTITIPLSLWNNATSTTNKFDDTLMAAAPQRIYRTHKYYRPHKQSADAMLSNNNTVLFQLMIPMESSYTKSETMNKTEVTRVYKVRFHFAETVRSRSALFVYIFFII